jgi:hypothetical protein
MRLAQAIQAAAAIVVGIFITFSQVHDALIGNIGILILAVGFAISSAVQISKNEARAVNTMKLVFYVALIGFGILLILQQDQLWFFTLIFVLPFVNGFFETGKFIASNKGSAERKDSALSALINFGLIAAISISGLVAGLDPVAFVGFFGAYAVILGIHLGISSASPTAEPAAKPKA